MLFDFSLPLMPMMLVSMVAMTLMMVLVRRYRLRSKKLAMAASEHRCLMALAGATDGVWDWDLTKQTVFYSEQFRDSIGLTNAEAPETIDLLKARLHPEDRESVMDGLNRHMHHKEPFETSCRLKTASGQYRWFFTRAHGTWDKSGRPVHLAGWIQDITESKQSKKNLKTALVEISSLKSQLEAEKSYLQDEIRLEFDHENIIGRSDSLQEVLQKVQQIAETDANVLILGETGTGKELFARAVHQASDRHDRALVKINCATLPANLIESELFGHERGAFTGAHTQQRGRFDIADGATLFLDEIGELPLELQPKLLRVLQEGEFERLGNSKTYSVDVRIIAATNRDLAEEVRKGNFREDLFFRLNVFPITLPPLRQRVDDIPLLAHFFIQKSSKKLGKVIHNVPKGAMQALADYSWPGNIRELENVIERAVINTSGPKLRLVDKLVSPLGLKTGTSSQTLAEVERDHITRVLIQTGWKVSGNKGASEVLGLNRSTLRARMRKLGITPPAG